MSKTMRAAMLLLAGLAPWPAAAQMLGPTWETDIVLTKGDLSMMLNALHQEVHGRAVGTVISWRNPRTGHFGTLELNGQFSRSGQRCERIGYTIAASTRDRDTEHFMFNMCLQPDGSWKFV